MEKFSDLEREWERVRETRGYSEWSRLAVGVLPSDGPDQFGHVGSPVGALRGSWQCLGVGQGGKSTEQDREQLLWPTCLGVNKRCITLR